MEEHDDPLSQRIERIFDFIKVNMEWLKIQKNMTKFLPMLHLVLMPEFQTGESARLAPKLGELMKMHNVTVESSVAQVILQITYQVLKTSEVLNREGPNLDEKTINTMVNIFCAEQRNSLTLLKNNLTMTNLASRNQGVRKFTHCILREVHRIICNGIDAFRLSASDNVEEERSVWATYIDLLESFEESDLHHADLSSAEVLRYMFDAINNMNFYNLEGYCLPKENCIRFCRRYQSILLAIFAEIEWNSVPLHFWLLIMRNTKSPDASKASLQLILKIAARVRELKNPEIRRSAIDHFKRLFAIVIEKLTMSDYALLIETLHRETDSFWCFNNVFIRKLKKCAKLNQEVRISERFYKIATYDLLYCYEEDKNKLIIVLQTLTSMPKEDHGLLRFIIALDLMFVTVMDKTVQTALKQFCLNMYDIDFAALDKIIWMDVISILCNRLAESYSQWIFVRQRSYDYFACHRVRCLINFGDNEGLTVQDLLCSGSHYALYALSGLLKWSAVVSNPNLLNLFVSKLKEVDQTKQYVGDIAFHIISYSIYLSISDSQRIVTNLMQIDPENVEISRHINNIYYPRRMQNGVVLKAVLAGTLKTDEHRIEDVYKLKSIMGSTKYCFMYYWNDPFLTFSVCEELMSMNAIMNQSYASNSREHRIKLRIAHALWEFKSIGASWYSEFWHPILQQDNQLSVIYIYEALIVYHAPNIDVLLEMLPQFSTLTNRQQISVLSVVFFYCIVNCNSIAQPVIFSVFRFFFKCATVCHGKVRLFAHLAIYRMLSFNFQLFSSLLHEKSLKTLKLPNGIRFAELHHDVRFLLPFLNNEVKGFIPSLVMYITGAPDDLYITKQCFSQFDYLKASYEKRNKDAIYNRNSENNVQSFLISYPADYTVAETSYFSTLCDLDGIMCACENLVKNSPTAELHQAGEI